MRVTSPKPYIFTVTPCVKFPANFEYLPRLPQAKNLAALSFALALGGESRRLCPHVAPRQFFLTGVVAGRGAAASVQPQLGYSWQLWRSRVTALLAAGYYRCPLLVLAPAVLHSVANALSWPTWPASLVLWRQFARWEITSEGLTALLYTLQPCVLLLQPIHNHKYRNALITNVPVLGYSGSLQTDWILWHNPSGIGLDFTAVTAGFSLCWALWQGRRLNLVCETKFLACGYRLRSCWRSFSLRIAAAG